MNLNKLQVTDDLQEQIAYGRELMDTYDSDMLKFINSIYDSYVNGEENYLLVNKICYVKPPTITGCTALRQNNKSISNYSIKLTRRRSCICPLGRSTYITRD